LWIVKPYWAWTFISQYLQIPRRQNH
jgi:hypothetical protein